MPNLPYLAALIDAKATITLASPGRGRSRRPLVSITLASPTVIEWLAESHGGYRRKNRDFHVWRIQDGGAVRLLEAVRPFVLIERRRRVIDLVCSLETSYEEGRPKRTERLYWEVQKANRARADRLPEVKPRRPSDDDFDYLRGLLDVKGWTGDGIEITANDPEVVGWLSARFGGSAYRVPRQRNAQRQLWAWRLKGARELRKANARLGDADSVEYAEVLRGDPCSYCGAPADENQTVDHIEPLHRGGSNEWENLTSACGSCNSSKHTHSLLEHLLVTADDDTKGRNA